VGVGDRFTEPQSKEVPMYEIKVETVPAVDQGSLPVFAEFDGMI
jgi:hypothetical protein